MPLVILEGGEQLFCHPLARCEGHACCVHNPSDHHMRGWRQHWRDDAQKMERLCPHGIGHPDPDDLAYQEQVCHANVALARIHGCDGCCSEKASK